MLKSLPKGHLSCLSNAFRYTPAADTNVAKTFARIKRDRGEPEVRTRVSPARTQPQAVHRGRPFPAETIERARQLLRAGGLRQSLQLVNARELKADAR